MPESDRARQALANHSNPVLKPFADRPGKAGKPHKLVIVAIVNALWETRKSWDCQVG